MRPNRSTLKITIAGCLLLALILQIAGNLHASTIFVCGLTLFLALWLQQIVSAPRSTETVRPPRQRSRAIKGQLLGLLESDIRGSLQILLDASYSLMAEDPTLAQRKQVLRIRETSASLGEIITRALDLAAVDSGKLSLNEMRFSLRECVDDAITSRRPTGERSKRQITTLIQTRVPDSLFGDARRLQNILIVLFEHVDVEDADSQLRVSLEKRIDDKATLRFTLSGAQLANLEKRLPLNEDDSITGDVQIRSDNDLAIVLTGQMIQAMGGRLEVVRGGEHGSALTFTVRLTVVKELQQTSTTQKTTTLGLIPDMPVMVVHDNNSAREDLQNLLNRWETVPTCVPGHSEMWDTLEDARRAGSPYGLIIIGSTVQGNPGTGLCAALQNDQLYSAVPRILLVDEGDESSVDGLTQFATPLVQPVNSVRLARTVLSAILGKGRYKQMRMGIEAAEIYVRSLIPPPMSEPIQIDWRYIAAAELAGDALGYHWIDDQHCAIYIIDVCGHGMDASLLSVSILNVLKSMTLPDTDFRQPDRVLHQLNLKFPMEAQGDRCFTAWYAVYDRPSGKLTWAGAGHPPALLFRADDPDSVQELASQGPMVGMISESEFASETCEISSGDRLIVYTDGVFEYQTPDCRFGSFEDYLAFIQSRRDSKELLDDLWNRARLATGSQALDDDFTAIDVHF